jgi:hypothetical protein
MESRLGPIRFAKSSLSALQDNEQGRGRSEESPDSAEASHDDEQHAAECL